MGPKYSTQKVLEELDRQNWMEEGRQQSQKRKNPLKLIHKMTGEEIDQFDVFFEDLEEYQQYKNICNFRLKHCQLVDVRYLNENHFTSICSLVLNIKVYIQRITLRLSNIVDIPFPDNLYIIQSSLNGFRLLFNRYSGFPITDDLICMTDDGIVKVWVNSNLAQSFPSPNYQKRKIKQSEMVWKILQIIDRITDKETQETSFVQFLSNSVEENKVTFLTALNLFHNFALKFKISVPKYFLSIIKKVREKKGIFQSQIDNESAFKVNERSRLRGIFKQSTVERVQTIKGSSIYSFSNRTYADQLKGFDNAASQSIFQTTFYPQQRSSLFAQNMKKSQSNKKQTNLRKQDRIFESIQEHDLIVDSADSEKENSRMHRTHQKLKFSRQLINSKIKLNPIKVTFTYNKNTKDEGEMIYSSRLHHQLEHDLEKMKESRNSSVKTEKKFTFYMRTRKERMTVDKKKKQKLDENIFSFELDPLIAEDLAKFEAEEFQGHEK